MREFKVVVLGPGGVGKSALTVQFISGKFVERYDPTVEDFYRKEIEVDGDPAILEILDTAGTEQFASMRDLYIKNGQGFIIVFSLTSRQSFQDIKLIREQILRVKGTNRVPIVLAANKFDIVETHREVDSDEGCRLANEWMVPYMETSAKNSSIVNTLFTEIVKEMNFKSISHGSSGRKEKKKFKMLTNTNLSSNINNKTNLSNNSSHSFTSNAKESTAKFKKADYDAHLSSCSFFHNCAKCFCVRSSPNKNYSSTNRSSNSFYAQETSNRCSIL